MANDDAGLDGACGKRQNRINANQVVPIDERENPKTSNCFAFGAEVSIIYYGTTVKAMMATHMMIARTFGICFA